MGFEGFLISEKAAPDEFKSLTGTSEASIKHACGFLILRKFKHI
jgi:hypothetical protein